jgi:hypothetical protein
MARRTLMALPEIRSFAQLPTGKRLYKYGNRTREMVKGGPGEPPPGFLGPTVSVTEWMVYWALSRYFLNPTDPRRSGPPFNGGPPDWTYQQPYLGGRFTPLGAVVDFIVWRTNTGRPLGIRVQTEYWHLYASREQQVHDLNQRGRLMDSISVVDIYDYTFSGDPTGAAVMQVVKNALGLIEIPDPLRSGTVRRNPRR